MKVPNFNIGSMMMIPKNKDVSKIFVNKSKILSHNRSSISRKPDNQAKQKDSSDSNPGSGYNLMGKDRKSDEIKPSK